MAGLHRQNGHPRRYEKDIQRNVSIKMKLSEQVSRAQVNNILAKLKSGKTISKAEQGMVAAYEAGTLPDLTLEEVAQHYGISRPGALKWKRSMAKAGLPWTTFQEIDKWRELKSKQATPGDINAVKKQKLEREVQRLDIKIERERGELVLKTEVREACVRIVSVWCSELDALVSDLPGQIGGLSETDMSPKLRSRIELLKRNAKNAFKDL
jgi:hypothetical protein